VTDGDGIAAPEVHYSMADNARRMLDFHIEKATESLVTAGAYKIEVDRLMRYSGWHLLGTARMGDDPKTSVLDRWNRAHDVPNLYVVDGSCFVTSSGVNPTSTIVAIALRAADHIVETHAQPNGANLMTAVAPMALTADERETLAHRGPPDSSRSRHAVARPTSSTRPDRLCLTRSARSRRSAARALRPNSAVMSRVGCDALATSLPTSALCS
jgi:hypothetical protein